MSKEELDILEEIINEELESYLQSGYSLKSQYAIKLRDLLKKLKLRELYDYDKRFNRKGEE